MVVRPRISTLDKLVQALGEELQELQERDLLRTLHPIEEIRGSTIKINGQWLILWCANDYLGLSTHPRVVQASCDAAKRWGVGARASRLLAGSTQLHEQLEERLASFFHAEAACVFSSGYLANLGTLSGLLNAEDLIFVDRLAHASLIDACRVSRATVRVFHHNDASHVATLLGRYTHARRRLIVTEGVFSMEGDFAPLERLLDVAQTHEALLYVDDAHGAFCLGPTGRGSPEMAGVSHEAMIYMGTLGKALGCQGGFVVGPRPLIEALRNRARTFIYTTALATPVVAAALEALRPIKEDPVPRMRLAQNVHQLHADLASLGRFRSQAQSHIVPIMIGPSRRAVDVSRELWQRRMFAPAIRPPTVPEGTARLRISVTALHTDEHLIQLVSALEALL